MSRTVDLFLDSDQPLDLVAAEISELIGATLSASPDRSRYVLQDGEVTAYLAEHDFLDDDELPLSAFPYVLSAQVRGGRDIDMSPEACCLRRVNSLWREGPGLPSLLVVDLERLDVSELEPRQAPAGTPATGPGNVLAGPSPAGPSLRTLPSGGSSPGGSSPGGSSPGGSSPGGSSPGGSSPGRPSSEVCK